VFRAQQLGDENRLAPDSVAESVRKLGRDAKAFEGAGKIADYLAAEAKPGDLLLIMSNGSFDGLCEKLLMKLAAAVPQPAGASRR
jgi:UDP-N-acetylmuramate: L-alanyl-gamma-D-glutamyl-meso-diaminopimelate ligase